MEVKIKNGNEMVDATIEMINGVMVVSPLVVNYKPNKGEIVTITSTSNGSYTCFYKEFNTSGVYAYGGLNNLYNMLFEDGLVCIKDRLKYIYPANEPERKKLFDKLAEEGFEFDFEKKELVKIKWKPKEGEKFYFPIFSDSLGEFVTDYQENDGTIFMSIERDWCFKTEQECQEFCNRLNDAINSVKP